MDSIINKLRLEATKPGRQATVYVKKGDTNSRVIEATVTSNGKTVELAGALVTMNAVIGESDYHIAGTVNEDGVTAHIVIPNSLLASPGQFEADIRFDDTLNGKVLSTATIGVIVEDVLYDDQSEEAQDDLDALAQYAQDSEAWAVGTRGGVTDPERAEDNSKYYAVLASQSASMASGSEQAAAGYANTAKGYKNAAETAQGKAEAAVGHYPRISGETGNWKVWDAENEEWDDTGVNAEGEDGVSPDVEIESITGGHSVTITDADHPSGQTFNVMDGEDGATVTFGTAVTADVQIAPPGDKIGDSYINTDSGKCYRWENIGAVNAWRYKGTLAPYIVKRGTVTLAAASWVGAASPYTYDITAFLPTLTVNSKVSLELSEANAAQIQADSITFFGAKAETENGTTTATVVSAGAKPSADMTVQYTVTETEAVS